MNITQKHYDLIKEKWKPFLKDVPTDEQFDCAFIINELEEFMNWGKINKDTFINLLEKVITIFTDINTEDHYNKVLDILEEKQIIKNKFNREDSEDKHLNFTLALCGDVDSVSEFLEFKRKWLQDLVKKFS
jgi:rubrerythrin